MKSSVPTTLHVSWFVQWPESLEYYGRKTLKFSHGNNAYKHNFGLLIAVYVICNLFRRPINL